jgi:hypothetical protein
MMKFWVELTIFETAWENYTYNVVDVLDVVTFTKVTSYGCVADNGE